VKYPTVVQENGHYLTQRFATANGHLRQTLRALYDTKPRATDYPADAFEQAVLEHNLRIQRVESVLLEMQSISEHIGDAMEDASV
jgi:hypothetical protein